MRTLTLDLDQCTGAYALYRVWQLKNEGAEEVYARTSSRGQGYHVKAFFEDLSSEERILRRVMLGDDPKRIFYDFRRESQGVSGSRVLFSQKDYGFFNYRAGDWRRFVPTGDKIKSLCEKPERMNHVNNKP